MESNKKRVKDFKIIDLIGSGATSNVYIARDLKNGIIGAIKIIKDNYIDDNETIKKYFSREVDATRSLNHENIIKLLDYGTYEHTYFLAYEYIQGVTLDKYIKKKNSIEEIEKISLQILSGLNYAHSKNVVHRDLKPKNIMIDSHGTIKIMDFGISKILDNRDMTKTNLFAGSPGYISPEQADPSIIENKLVDNRADLYSFGILLFELLTNTLPFNSETPWGIIHKHLSEPPPDLKKIKKDVPLYLAEIVEKCLKKNREERYSTAQEIIKIIEKKEMHGKEKSNSDTRIISNEKDLKEEVRVLKQEMMHIKKTLELLLQENSRLKKEVNPFKKIQTVQDGMLGQDDPLKKKRDESKNSFSSSKAQYFIGDVGPAGGWVFYAASTNKENSWHYLEAAPRDVQAYGSDLFSFCQQTYLRRDPYQFIGASESKIGSGKKNTKKITDFYGEGGYAAWICKTFQINGYKDWFLPSYEELKLMRNCLYKKGIGRFSFGSYWSSTECNETEALGIIINEILIAFSPNTSGKGCCARVRAIRAF